MRAMALFRPNLHSLRIPVVTQTQVPSTFSLTERLEFPFASKQLIEEFSCLLFSVYG